MNIVKIPKKRIGKIKSVPLRQDLVAVTKDLTAALVLKQMIYWTEKMEDLDQLVMEENERLAKHGMDQREYSEGWIYKSHRQMSEELFGLVSEDTVGRAFAKLMSIGLFQTRRNPKFAYDRTVQYRLDLILLRRLLRQEGYELSNFALDINPEIDSPIPQIAESKAQIAGAIPESINLEGSSSLHSEEPSSVSEKYPEAKEEFFPQDQSKEREARGAKPQPPIVPADPPSPPRIATRGATEAHNTAVNIMKAWNLTCLPQINSMTSDRKRKVSAALNQIKGFRENWLAAIAFCAGYPFYNGTGKRAAGHENWRFTVDNFLTERFFVKILEKMSSPEAETPEEKAMRGFCG